MPHPEPLPRVRAAAAAALILAFASAVPSRLAASPVAAVSPGSPDGVVAAAGPCPTFSWTYQPAASAYELVAYRLRGAPAVGPAEDETPVLRQVLPAGAVSWTPSANRCLVAGEEYVWFVRAETAAGNGSWSEGNLFRILDLGEPATPAASSERHGGPVGLRRPASGRDSAPGMAAIAPSPVPSPGMDPAATNSLAPKAAAPLFSVSAGMAVHGDYGFDGPRTVHRAYPPAAFRLANSQEDEQWFIEAGGSGTIRGGSGTLDARIAVGLDDLPVGATVKTLACRFRDQEEGEDMSGNFTLARRFVNSGSQQVMAQVSFATAGSGSSVGLAITHTISHPVVESFYHYWILGSLTVEGPFFTLEFLGCELEYDVDHLDTR